MANYCKKIIILSQAGERAAGSAREVSGIVKIERTAAELRCKTALFNLNSAEDAVIGIKCVNMPLQQFPAGQNEFALDYNSELNAPISCIVAYADGRRVLPIASGSTDKRGFSAAILAGFVKNITYNLDKYGGIYKKSEAARAAEQAAARDATQETEQIKPEAGHAFNRTLEYITPPLSESRPAEIITPVTEPEAVPVEIAEEIGIAALPFAEINRIKMPPPLDAARCAAPLHLEKIKSAAAPPSSASATSIEIIEPAKMSPSADLARDLMKTAVLDINTEINDEIVATENYFEYEKEFENKFKAERIMTKRMSDAFDFNTSGDCRYYARVKDELERLFSSYPPENTLNGIIEDSNWVRINYKDDKYYSVGAIGYKNKPLYICYAVPAEYSSQPPAELEGACQWLPKKYSAYTGDGYWIMYQDADTGDTIKDIIF
jgi:hypothetical protein